MNDVAEDDLSTRSEDTKPPAPVQTPKADRHFPFSNKTAARFGAASTSSPNTHASAGEAATGTDLRFSFKSGFTAAPAPAAPQLLPASKIVPGFPTLSTNVPLQVNSEHMGTENPGRVRSRPAETGLKDAETPQPSKSKKRRRC